MTVPIVQVLNSGVLLLDCDDQEGVNLLLGLKVEDEEFEVLQNIV